jgi:nucleoid-associated protein YgaU
MTAELRRGLFLAILGLVGGLGAVALLAYTGLLVPSKVSTQVARTTAPQQGASQVAPSQPAPSQPTPGQAPTIGQAPANPPPIAGAGAGAPQPTPAQAGRAEPKATPSSAAPGPTERAAAPTPEPGAPVAQASAAPTFDVIRVEPDGAAVIAGRGTPNATVELLRGGEVFARGLADPSGLFALVPPPLPTGTSEITVRTGGPDGPKISRDSVLVVVSPKRDAKPLVALTSPEKPTVVLSRPEAETTAAATPTANSAPRPGANSAASPAAPTTTSPQPAAPAAPTAPQPVKVVSVEAEDGGRLYVSAQAAPGATVRLYLNDTLVAPGSVGPDGRVAFAIGRGMKPGDYRVRIDQVDPVSGVVRTRSEVPFTFPKTLSTPPPVAAVQPPTEGAAATARNPVPSARGTAPANPATAARTAPTATGEPVSAAPVASPNTPPASGAAAPAATGRPAEVAVAAPPAALLARPGSPQASDAAAQGTVAPAPATSNAPARVALVPQAVAPAAERPASSTATSAGADAPAKQRAAGTVFVPQLDTATVVRGDNLWRISRKIYGAGTRYTVIYDANQPQIRRAELIYPGQVFVLPGTAANRQADGTR